MEDIFSLSHFVTDIEEFMKTGDVRREFFREPFPVTTTVQVVRLYDPDLLVEITVIDHSSQLDDASKLHLTPTATCLRLPECLHQ